MTPAPGGRRPSPPPSPPGPRPVPGSTIRTILVLCEGNHCRAPIAEALLRAEVGPAIQVASAGLRALVGEPAHPEAVRLLEARGLGISSHRGRQVTPDLARAADLILVMDSRQKEWCTQLVPSVRGRIFILGHWLSVPPREIADPYGQGPEQFRQAFEDIQRAVAAWVPRLLPEQRPA